jgi:hypothetical protein
LAFDSAGNLYIADSRNDLVRRVAAQTGIISTVAGNGNTQNFVTPAPDGTPALSAYLSNPTWVSFDRSGYLLISEDGSASIQRVDAAGLLRNVAGNGTWSFTGDGVPATSSGINSPSNVVLDPAGNMYFADQNGRVRRIDGSTGIISTIAGNGTGTHGSGSGSCSTAANGDNGPATSATLDDAYSVLLAPSGNLLFSDIADCRIRQVALPSPYPYTATNLTASATSLGQGQSVTLTATVSPIGASGGPTGTIQFADVSCCNPAVPLGSATLSGGTASLTLSSLSLGFHNVVAYYSGDPQFNNSASPQVSVRVQLPTMVTLSSSRNPATANQPVTLTATIPQLPAAPYNSEGNVNFMDGPTLLGSAMVWNGSAQISYTFAAPGSHSLTAVFTGYDTYAGSTSAPLTQTVLGATTTTLSANNATVTFGQPVQLTASVSPATATGTVQFFDGTTALGTASLSSGTAAFTASTLSAGSHSLTATYSGDSGNATSTSGAVSVTVSQVSSSISLSTSPNPSSPGQNVTLTATVSPGTATGTVQFLDGSTSMGTAAISSGAATLAVSSLAVGAHSITAVYGGDGNNATSSSATVTQTVNQAPSRATLLVSASGIAYGQNVNLTAAVSPATATGMVQFMDGGTVIATQPLSNGTVPTVTATNLTVGSHPFTAVYSGDSSYTGSTSPVASVTVSKASSALTLSSSPNPSNSVQPVTFTAVVSPSTATGTVQFLDGSTSLGTVTITSGSAALSLSTLAAGSHSITAVYSGDTDYVTSTSAAVTQTVNKANSTVALISSANPSVFGAPVTLTATITPASATGSVQFLDGATVLGTAAVSGGSAALTTSSLGTGSHSIVAVYSGDAQYAGSTSAALSQTVNKAATTVVAGASPNPSTFGQSVTISASVTPAGATGTVQFVDGGSVIGTTTLSGGTASITTSALGGGVHSITAVYGGDPSYLGSTSAALSQTVNRAPSALTIVSSANPVTAGFAVTFTAALTHTPASATGSIQFLDGSTVLGTVALSSGGAALTTSSLAAGSHTITAVYSGDGNVSGSFVSLSQSVLTPTSISLTSDHTSTSYGQNINFTATVSPSAATGTIVFMDGSVVLGSVALSGGHATLAIATLSAGTHIVTASYSGDAADAAAPPVARTVTVAQVKPAVNVAASPDPALMGQTVTLTAKISANAATGTVTFNDGAQALGTAAVSNGAAVFSTSALAAGNHSITAVYSGDINYTSATSNKDNVNVK